MKHRGHLLTWTSTTVAVDGQNVPADVAVAPGNGHGHADGKGHSGAAIKVPGGRAWGGDVIMRFEDGSYQVLCPWRRAETAKALAPAAELHQLLGAQALGGPVAGDAIGGLVAPAPAGEGKASKPPGGA